MSQSTFEFVKLLIQDKLAGAIDCRTPYAKVLLNEITKAAFEGMRILVKNDPIIGNQADDIMLQKYIDNALK